MKPSVGRRVHYVSHGTPVLQDGSQAFESTCRAAIVTEVAQTDLGDGQRIGLVALNPTGMFFHSLADGGCVRHDGSGDQDNPGYVGGTWHWPEGE